MQELLSKLSSLNVRVEVRDDRIHVSAPDGALTNDLREQIREHKEALIALLTRAQQPEAALFPALEPDPLQRHEPFSLNEVQHAYWVGRQAQIELGGVASHIYFELECTDLDLARLNAAFNHVVAQHDMLRAIVQPDGRQRVLRTVDDYTIVESDLRPFGAGARKAALTAIRAELSERQIACERWPLFDLRAARIDERHTRLFLSWDFIFLDAWSLLLVFRQWNQCYRDPTFRIDPTRLSFRDYVLAELGHKSLASYRASQVYWWDRIDTLPTAPQLPLAAKLAHGQRPHFSRRSFELDAATWQALKTRARQAGITPSSVLLAAFAEVLNRWSKLAHYCLTLTLFNRRDLHPDVGNLVGDFTNLLLLEVDGRKGNDFCARARGIQDRFLTDYEHREVSAIEVLRELARRRNEPLKAIAPVVFTSTLMLDGTEGDGGGLEQFGQLGWGISQTPQVWLDYQIFERDGRLLANWDAVDEVFLPGVLDAMFAANRDLLATLAHDPHTWTRESALPLPSPQQACRNAIDATDGDWHDACLHEGFMRRAFAAPERIALRSSNRVLSYGEVLARAHTLSLQLVALGAQPNLLVAVVMDKGWEQTVAVMAILMSGAAYLPIDPRWPQLRRDEVLARAEVRIVLTQSALDGRLQLSDGLHRVIVDDNNDPPQLHEFPRLLQMPQDLAYVIFTSGSTGTPKGVMIDHRAALNTVAHINRLFEVTEHDTVLALSDLGFDLSVFDIFGTLAAGGTLVVPDPKFGRDPAHWCELVRTHAVTVWNSAPQLMNLAVEQAEVSHGVLEPLRLVMLSGDWIPIHLPERVRRLATGAQVISLGGATEGAIWSIYYPIVAIDPAWDSIPYGKALPNQRMYVLDSSLQICPDYVTGQICIGGAGVALGYWKDPERTGDQFVVHPTSGERLYLTGDLGRYLPDGNIEFLGREDAQVKLRGYRVELGEIAANLQAHPGVREAAVRVLKCDGRSTLWGYVVPNTPRVEPLFGTEEMPAAHAQARTTAITHAATVQAARADGEALLGFARFWEALDHACLASMTATLGALGVLGEVDAQARLAALEAEGCVLPGYRRLLTRWLCALEGEAWLSSHHGRYHLAASRSAAEADTDLQLSELSQALGNEVGTRDFFEYVERSLRNTFELLDGRKTPLELLYPGGCWRSSEALYENNPVVRQHNAVLGEIVRALVSASDASMPLRLLEIGAGGGGTTSAVLPHLPIERSEYRYTDVSAYYFTKARNRFAEYPFLTCSLLDLNKAPDSLDHEPHSYDLIVAGNALHNAVDLNTSLGYLRTLLKPGGHLLLLEGTRNTPWSLATVGFLEGTESYSDQRAKTGVPILDADGWREALSANGFTATLIFPDEIPFDPALREALATAMPQHVIVAQGPGQVARFQPDELVRHLADRLPDYMVPQRYMVLDRLPLSANGKVDLDSLPSAEGMRAGRERKLVEPESQLEKQLLELWKRVLNIPRLSIADNFFDLGGDSLQLTELQRHVSQLLGRSLPIAELFAHSSVRALARHLRATPESDLVPERQTELPMLRGSGEIAVIGLAGRFPDATDPDQLWRNVAAGHCAVRSFSDEELLAAGVSPRELAQPGYVKAAPVLADMDRFDAAYFGIPPAEAAIMDPQQRFLLECAVEALESAGYPDEREAGRIGVFAGKGVPLYLVEHVLGRADIVARLGLNAILREHEKDHAATLISYKLNLTGPSLSINTACSTSLVAVHAACQSLIMGECEVALAGGASFVTTLKKSGYQYHEGQIFSPDGYCRAFSDLADGTIFGCGAGLVVLKPLATALRDRDTIHAVIKGTAINNDGGNKVGYSAPSASGQAKVIAAALAAAGVEPDSIQYVEAHGTGTRLGDPVEFSALRKVYGGSRTEPVALGSLKSNIGHLDTAAGIAGLIKLVQAIKHRQIPPTLHADAPSRAIDFADSAFRLNQNLRDWPQTTQPRRGAVSSFGVGGTNAHAIVEEAPVLLPRVSDDQPQLLVFSAASEAALERTSRRLGDHLRSHPEIDLDQVAFTLQAGRHAQRHRRHIVCRDRDEVLRVLDAGSTASTLRSELQSERVAFLLPGQGAPLHDCASGLYRRNRAFRTAFDSCARIVESYCGIDLHEHNAAGRSADTEALPTELAQPLLFSLEYSLVQYWLSLGVKPAAMLGHSLGEYVAACVAGVFSLEEALALVVARGQLMQGLPQGRMLAVACDEATLTAYLDGSNCSIAAINAPTQCVASGTDAAIEELQRLLEGHGVDSRALKTSHAFHSHMMDAILEVYAECVTQIELKAPSIPFVSSMTGDWISDEQATSPAYWVQHLRNPVKFSIALGRLNAVEGLLLLEVGPGRGLTALARANSYPTSRCMAPHSHDYARSDHASLLDAIGRLWSLGVVINWCALHDMQPPGRVPLPTYPFEKTSHWIERRAPMSTGDQPSAVSATAEAQAPHAAPALHVRPALPANFAAPSSEIEIRVASVWTEFLGIDAIDIDDNFFDLGGDSLLATRVYSQLTQQFNIRLPLQRIFELATIRRQALFILISTDPDAMDTLTESQLDELTAILSTVDQAVSP